MKSVDKEIDKNNKRNDLGVLMQRNRLECTFSWHYDVFSDPNHCFVALIDALIYVFHTDFMLPKRRFVLPNSSFGGYISTEG
jgi:hypothetical protein